MTGSRSFKDLVVWQRSLELVREVYLITEDFPRQEVFSLTSQIRRSAVSIPSNIAEGSKRGTTKDFVQFLRIADGSSAELQTQLYIAEMLYPKLNYSKATDLLTEVQKMLNKLLASLKTGN